jgi:TonB-linked SusC/RagA family outer membrane protein
LIYNFYNLTKIYESMKRILLISFVLMASLISEVMAQRTVSGQVTSGTDGEGLPGVSVRAKGTSTGVTTDFDGNYRLQVPEGVNTLVFSFVGFEAQEVEIGNRSTVDVVLQEDVQQLQEVVVTALGISREERSLGYAVQEVKGEEFTQAKETNVVNALAGQVAGVQVQGTSGAMGGASRVTIRGSSSFLGENQPLFVVDGVPIDNSNYATTSQQAGFGGGAYDYGNAASDINPDDIESMSVLKGATATALYGARGANGVILITTKSGKGKKGIGVSVNSNITTERPLTLLPHQQKYGGGAINPDDPSGFFPVIENGQRYLVPAYAKDGSWGPRYDPNLQVRHWDSWDPDSPNYGETRPWVAPENDYTSFFETGVTYNNNVALAGSNDQGNFRLSYTNVDQTGIMPNSGLARNTISFNSAYNLSDRLRADAGANYVVTEAYGRSATGYNNNNVMQGFTQWWQTQLDFDRLKNYRRVDGTQQTWNPKGPIVDEDNNLIEFDENPMYFDNPYWVRYENFQQDRRDRLFGNFGLNYELAEGLTISGKASIDSYTFRAEEGRAVGGIDIPSYSEVVRQFRETNLDARISYDRRFGEVSFNAIAGGNQMRQSRNYNRVATTEGLSLPNFYHISNSVGTPIIEQEEVNIGINSLYGMVSTGWRDMVYVDLTIRSDWSSTLPPHNNPYVYPSVTGSFVFTELAAFQNIGFLSFGKLRASVGRAGNGFAPPYQLYSTFTPLTPNMGADPRFSVPNLRPNPDLRAETTDEWEVGMNLKFLQGRIGADVAYYNKLTYDQIFPVASSAATGYTSRLINAGEMRNTGLEVAINATPIQTEDFSWDLGINFSRVWNKVESLAEGVENIRVASTWAAHLSIEEGLPYMAIMGQDFVRDEDGNRIVDENGFYRFTQDRVFLGSAIADYTGGFKNAFRYKGFVLAGLMDFQKGGAIHSTSLQWAKYSGMHPETAEGNIREEGMILEGVTEDGQPNTRAIDPQVFYQTTWGRAAMNYYDASFVKLRELRFGYSLPNRIFGNNLPFRDVNISLVGRNLAILYSSIPFLDPQMVTGSGNEQGLENAQIPSTRSVGVNISFKL